MGRRIPVSFLSTGRPLRLKGKCRLWRRSTDGDTRRRAADRRAAGLRCGSASGRLTCNPRPAGVCPNGPAAASHLIKERTPLAEARVIRALRWSGGFSFDARLTGNLAVYRHRRMSSPRHLFPESGGHGSSGRGRCGLLNSMWQLGRLFPRSGRLAQFSRGGRGLCAVAASGTTLPSTATTAARERRGRIRSAGLRG
jgi:hypothetical protein